MENEISPVSKVISTVMQIPGIKVDREKFLRSEFRLYCTQEELEKVVENPLEIIPKNRIEKIADACIRNQTAKVSLLSTIAGVPGGLACNHTCRHGTVLLPHLRYGSKVSVPVWFL